MIEWFEVVITKLGDWLEVILAAAAFALAIEAALILLA